MCGFMKLLRIFQITKDSGENFNDIFDNDDEGDLKIDGDCGLTRQTRTTCSLGRE